MATVTSKIEVQLSAPAWTDISADVLGSVTGKRGMDGRTPADVVAGPGALEFDLDNSTHNSGATVGYYSPAHASVRSGWALGKAVRWTLTSVVDGAKVVFYGKIDRIDPMPGAYRDRRVRVSCSDAMRDLVDASVRSVTTQVMQTEDVLIDELLDSLPTAAQPPARSLAVGSDVISYAFGDLAGGAQAAGVIGDIVRSSQGVFYVTGGGTATYKTRQQRLLASSSLTLSDATLIDLTAPVDIAAQFNRVRTTIHPKTLDSVATSVLYSQQGEAPRINASQTITVWGEYRSEDNTAILAGGTDLVTTLVSGTDYVANTAPDGSGSDVSSDISIVCSGFASSAKFVITNNGAVPAFLTTLQIRGRGVLDIGARTFESSAAADYGDRTFDLDMPYQDNPYTAQDLATVLRQFYDSITSQVESLSFVANQSASLMTAALTLEPSNIVTVSETVTGLSSVLVAIQSVELTYQPSGDLRCRWAVAPYLALGPYWKLGSAGFSELGDTTTLGF